MFELRRDYLIHITLFLRLVHRVFDDARYDLIERIHMRLLALVVGRRRAVGSGGSRAAAVALWRGSDQQLS